MGIPDRTVQPLGEADAPPATHYLYERLALDLRTDTPLSSYGLGALYLNDTPLDGATFRTMAAGGSWIETEDRGAAIAALGLAPDDPACASIFSGVVLPLCLPVDRLAEVEEARTKLLPGLSLPQWIAHCFAIGFDLVASTD